MPEIRHTSTPQLPTPWPPAGPVDLKELMQDFANRRPPRAARPTHGGYRRTTRILESEPQPISSPPIRLLGFLDGIQNRCLLGRAEHRDLTIAYAAAGLTDGISTLLHVEERLAVVCSSLDEGLVRDRHADVPVVALPELHPWNLALAVDDWIDQTRRDLEARALANAPSSPHAVIVVDGSLPAATARDDLVGIVKEALATDWLPDPELIPAKQGWRSAGLLLPAERAGERDRLSAYVRLRTATPDHAWGYSLVRVETFAEAGVAGLDAACALAMTQTQPPGAPDPRWEVQPAGMYRTEEILKARSPFAVQHFS